MIHMWSKKHMQRFLLAVITFSNTKKKKLEIFFWLVLHMSGCTGFIYLICLIHVKLGDLFLDGLGGLSL